MRNRVLGIAALALPALLAVLARDTDARSPGVPRTKLRVAMQPYLGQAPLLIAEADSMFAQEGLDVEFVRIANSIEGVAPLLSGALDVLPSTASAGLLNSMARGLAVRIVADRGFLDPTGCTVMAIAVPPGRAAAAAASPHQVKHISMPRLHAMSYIMDRMLASVGLSVESLEASDIPPLPEAEALAAGKIDAALVGEPWLSRDIAGGKAEIWIRAERVLPNLQSGFIFFGPNLLTRNRDAGRRFMIAYRRGVRRYLEGKTSANIALLSKATGETPELLGRACWPPMHASGRIDLASLRDYQRWLRAKGLVRVAATPAQMWDSSFVVYADSVLGRRRG